MRMTIVLAAGLSALALAACNDTGDTSAERPAPPAKQSEAAAPAGTAAERAREALGEAGDATQQTLEALGEAGQAGLEVLQENAPEIRARVDEAGERLRNAADALLKDPDGPPLDAEGDSEADLDEVPENREVTPQ